MEMQGDAFARFILQDRRTLGFMESDEPDNVSYYVVMAKIYGILSTSPLGIECAVADHTGRSIFALRDIAAGEFFDQHMFQYPEDELIVDPYALDNEWEQTYLFKICKGQQAGFVGHSAFLVNDICMLKPVVDQFAAYKMTEQEQNYYHEATSAVQRREFPTNIGSVSSNDLGAIHPNFEVGFKKRIYAPLQGSQTLG